MTIILLAAHLNVCFCIPDFNTEVLENAIKENAAEEAEKKAEGAFDVAVAKTEAFIDVV